MSATAARSATARSRTELVVPGRRTQRRASLPDRAGLATARGRTPARGRCSRAARPHRAFNLYAGHEPSRRCFPTRTHSTHPPGTGATATSHKLPLSRCRRPRGLGPRCGAGRWGRCGATRCSGGRLRSDAITVPSALTRSLRLRGRAASHRRGQWSCVPIGSGPATELSCSSSPFTTARTPRRLPGAHAGLWAGGRALEHGRRRNGHAARGRSGGRAQRHLSTPHRSVGTRPPCWMATGWLDGADADQWSREVPQSPSIRNTGCSLTATASPRSCQPQLAHKAER